MSVALGQLVQQRPVHPIQRFGVCSLRSLRWLVFRYALHRRFLQLMEPVGGPRGVDFVLAPAIAFALADSPNLVVADRTPVWLAADRAGRLFARLPPTYATHHSSPDPLVYCAVAQWVV